MSWQIPSPLWSELDSGTTRICTKCGEKLPATPEFFNRYNRNGIGLRSECAECTRKEQNKIKYCKQKATKRHGISVEEYDRMCSLQNDKCAICDMTSFENGRLFAIDHDHKTGDIRGLLCKKCNPMLGFADDSIDVLLKAIEYLRNNQEKS